MDSQTTSFRVLMFPWLGHGHIFPYLELAKRILKRKPFYIYICSTAINFSSINNFIETNSLHKSIEVVELHLEPSPQLPPHYHTTKNLPPNLMVSLLQAFQTSSSSFSDIIKNLAPDLVIYDIFQPWAARLASRQGIPAVHFAAFGAATVSFSYYHYSPREDSFPFPELYLKTHEMKIVAENMADLLRANACQKDKDVFLANSELSSDVVLLKTSRGFEGKYIDYVSAAVSGKKLLAVGPLVTEVRRDAEESSDLMQWLSKKSRHSTVYISFGSTSFLSKDEITEIAKGLEICDANFIWIIRFPVDVEKSSTEELLPQGFLDRVGERGRVIFGWAPQANILAHPSTGGFVSHCGWSSVMESVYFGVPVIGMPIKFNMFIDARMMVEAGVCVEVPRDEDGVFAGEEIANAINKVIVEKIGEELRHRARDLSEKMKMEEVQALDEAAEQLWQLCLRNNKLDI